MVVCDSRQIYRELDITTAAPSEEEKKAIRHHLAGMLSPSEETTSFQYREAAAKAIVDALSRGKVPVLSVGTGFYYRALRTGGLVSTPDLSVRAAIQALSKEERLSRLKSIRPELLADAGGHIHDNDDYRITRALEIASSPQSGEALPEFPCEFSAFYLEMEVSELNERLRLRAMEMVRRGLVEELRLVHARYGMCHGLKTIGFSLVQQLLAGQIGTAELAERLWIDHRQYAKRQRTWFRRELVDRKGSAGDFEAWVRLFVDPDLRASNL